VQTYVSTAANKITSDQDDREAFILETQQASLSTETWRALFPAFYCKKEPRLSMTNFACLSELNACRGPHRSSMQWTTVCCDFSFMTLLAELKHGDIFFE
jgi:hypothetical protein